MATVSIARVVLGEMSDTLKGDLCHITRIVVRVVPERHKMLSILNYCVWSAFLSPLLDMLSASIWQEDRVGSRDRPGAIGGLARVEVGPVVVVVHTVLVVVRMRLLLERGIIVYKHAWFQRKPIVWKGKRLGSTLRTF